MAISELPNWGKDTTKYVTGTLGFGVGFGKSNKSVPV